MTNACCHAPEGCGAKGCRWRNVTNDSVFDAERREITSCPRADLKCPPPAKMTNLEKLVSVGYEDKTALEILALFGLNSYAEYQEPPAQGKEG